MTFEAVPQGAHHRDLVAEAFVSARAHGVAAASVLPLPSGGARRAKLRRFAAPEQLNQLPAVASAPARKLMSPDWQTQTRVCCGYDSCSPLGRSLISSSVGTHTWMFDIWRPSQTYLGPRITGSSLSCGR